MTRTLREKFEVDSADWNVLAREACVPSVHGVESLDLYFWPRRERVISRFAGSVFTVPERRLACDSTWLVLRAEVSHGRGMVIRNAFDYVAGVDGRIIEVMKQQLAQIASRIPADELLVRCVRRMIHGSASTRRGADERILFDEAGFQSLQHLPAPERAVLNAALWVGLSPWRIAELGFGNVGTKVDDVARVYSSGRAMIA